MSTPLSWINLGGVAVLAGLCVVQWSVNRRIELDRLALEKVRVEHEGRLAEQTRRLAGQTADLESFRRHVIEANAAVRTNEARFNALERELDALRGERDHLRTSMTNWMIAVRERDEHLGRAAGELKRVVEERDAMVARVNELGGRHNKLVEELNQRTRDFNELVAKYGELAKARGGAK